MKPIVYLPVIVLSALGIGVFQHSRLNSLREEAAQFAGGDARRSAEIFSKFVDLSTNKFGSAGKISPAESQARIGKILVHMTDLNAKFGLHNPMDQAEREESRRLMVATFAELDAQSAFDLIQNLKTSESVPPEIREHSAEFCLEILMEVNPEAA